MRSDLYKKMTDDERLQYICNLENVKESLDDVKFIQSEIMGIYKRLVNCTESYTHYEEQRRHAFERYNHFKEEMLYKYDEDACHTCTCDDTPVCVEDEGALND